MEGLKRYKVALLLVGVLVAFSPLFAWAAAKVGYAEPLENAAEKIGAEGGALLPGPGLLPDYGIPGINEYLGTFISGVVGTIVTLGLALLISKLLRKERNR